MLISPLAVSWWLKQSALYWDSVPSSLVLSLHRLCAYVVCVILNASVITASMISMCIQENDGFQWFPPSACIILGYKNVTAYDMFRNVKYVDYTRLGDPFFFFFKFVLATG